MTSSLLVEFGQHPSGTSAQTHNPSTTSLNIIHSGAPEMPRCGRAQGKAHGSHAFHLGSAAFGFDAAGGVVSMKSAIGRVTRERHRGNAFAARSTVITVCDRSPGFLSVARTLVI